VDRYIFKTTLSRHRDRKFKILSRRERLKPTRIRDYDKSYTHSSEPKGRIYTHRHRARFQEIHGKTIWSSIEKEPESRREWLQYMFKYYGKHNVKEQVYQIWTHDNHPIVLWSKAVIAQKINYIHQNPVRAGWVLYPEQYIYSSASNYRDGKGIIDVKIPDELFAL
jgi:hypothetical protein